MARRTNIRDILADNIRRSLSEQGLAINGLADLAGVSRSQLYDVLACRKGASIDWIERVAKVLEQSVSTLLRERGGAASGGAKARKRRKG